MLQIDEEITLWNQKVIKLIAYADDIALIFKTEKDLKRITSTLV